MTRPSKAQPKRPIAPKKSRPPEKRKRTRLAPEVRRNQLLDFTAAIVTEAGVSAVNMEKLARRAGVSKPLVYLYFPTRADLLRALLDRELARNRAENIAIVSRTTTMEEMVRETSRYMLTNAAKMGAIVQRLLSEPEIAEDVLALRARYAQATTGYLSTRLEKEYGIPHHISEPAVEIALGMSGAAAQLVARSDIDVSQVEDILTTMIMGAVQAVASDHGAPSRRRKSARR